MIHLQSPVNNWLQAVDLLPDQSLVKAVDNVQALAEVKAHNANIKTVLRHWYDPGQVFGGTFEQNKQRARAFFDTWIDGTFAQYAAHVNYVLEFNEYIAQSHNATEKADRIRWARACAEVWRDEYRTRPGHGHIRLALCSTAVGNDIPWEYAQIATQYDCILSYHAYTFYQNGQRGADDWQYLSGRWAAMDADFRARGYTVQWMFGECGPFQSAATGWRHVSCLGGNQSAYVEAVRRWIRDCRGTHAFQTGRLIGFNLFTTGGGSQWQWFETRQPELNALAQMTAVEWTGQPEPPPPPPPTGDTRTFEDGWTDDPADPGRRQIPNGFTLTVIPQGQQLWYPDHAGQRPSASGTLEATHKLRGQLPTPDHYLILDGDTTYKMQAVSMRQGVTLSTTFTGAGRKRVTVPVNCHYQPPDIYGRQPPLEVEDVYAVLLLNGQEVDRFQFPGLLDRQWVHLEGEADGPVTAVLRFQTSYANTRDLFTDHWTAVPVEEEGCRGAPRIQYRRRVNVLPGSATIVQWRQVLDATFGGRETITGSYDDAGIGDLDNRTAVLWFIPSGERQGFRDWYGEHYPGVVVEFRG